MKVGYARIANRHEYGSKRLQQAGCQQVFTDRSDDVGKVRPGLELALEHMVEGDTLVVWRLAHLGRSLKQVIDIVNQLGQKGFGVQSLQEALDTSAEDGQVILHVFAILAETERNLVRERTQKGLRAARARGRKGGRPKGLSESAQRTAEIAESLYLERELTVSEICAELSISKPTLYSYLRHRGVKTGISS